MPRADLLALTLDDLVALSNRGNVNKARAEVEKQGLVFELTETEDGAVKVTWSDGPQGQVPAGAALAQGTCTCPVALMPCRHLIRLVFAYQMQARESAPAGGAAEAVAPPSAPWDPGAFTDDDLAEHFRAQTLNAIRKQFEQGVLVELVRSAKPSARFHVPTSLVQFLVPGDLRYTRCDCAEQAPCRHVPLAVWSFRQLAAEQQSGIVATGKAAPPVPADLLGDLNATLLELAEQGLAGASGAFR